MKSNYLKKAIFKILANQLRRPSGFLAKRVGNNMNKTNRNLYSLTQDTMKLMDGNSVLEIGFGNGKFFEQVLSKANDLSVSGMDFSLKMVKEANINNQSAISSGKLNLKCGCSDNIPFNDASFDVVYCINVIYFWKRPVEHLKEVYRVLKPNGKFYATFWTKESMLPLPIVKYGFILYSEEEWKSIVEDSGFHFVMTEKASDEEELDKQSYPLDSLCVVAEKLG